MSKKALPFVFLIGTLAFIFYLFCKPMEARNPFIKEGGLLELITAGSFFLSALICLWYFLTSPRNKFFWFELLFITAFFGFRELDFHLLFTEGASTMRGDFYFNNVFSLPLRGAFACFYFLLFSFVIHLVVRYRSFLIGGIRKAENWAITASVFLLALGAAVLTERALKDILKLFISTERAGSIEEIVEEPLEFLAAVLLIFLILQMKKPFDEWRIQEGKV